MDIVTLDGFLLRSANYSDTDPRPKARPNVVVLLKGETTVIEAARRHDLKVAEVEEWRERFLLGAENASRARPRRRWVGVT
jgi:hypothetical protein